VRGVFVVVDGGGVSALSSMREALWPGQSASH
jgi:hypothetical protein